MTQYEYMYWMFRYGIITEAEWDAFCIEYLFNNIMVDEGVKNVFKRLKFT